jgi:hypothetical protein
MSKIEAFAVTGKTLALWTIYPLTALWRAFTGGSMYYGVGTAGLGLFGLLIALAAVGYMYVGEPWLAAGIAVGYYVFGLFANISMQGEWQEELF